MYLFIEKLLSSSNGVGIEFQEMIFQWVYRGSAGSRHPLSQALSAAKATRREESHRVQVHGSVEEAKTDESCGCRTCEVLWEVTRRKRNSPLLSPPPPDWDREVRRSEFHMGFEDYIRLESVFKNEEEVWTQGTVWANSGHESMHLSMTQVLWGYGDGEWDGGNGRGGATSLCLGLISSNLSFSCQPKLFLWKAFPELPTLILGTPLPHTAVFLVGPLPATTKLCTPTVHTLSSLSACKAGREQGTNVRRPDFQGQGRMSNVTPQGRWGWPVRVTCRIPNLGSVLAKTDHLRGKCS